MKRYTFFFACMLFAFSPMFVFAQGSDDAFDVVYNDGWDNGDNGGSGFGAWTSLDDISTFSGHFIGSSDIGSESWAFWANTGNTSDGSRTFNTTPSPNDKITFQMDNGSIQNGGTVGMSLQTSGGTNKMEVYFVGGQSNYVVNHASGPQNSTLGYTSAGLEVEIQLTSSTTFSVKLTDLNTSATSTVNGTFMVPGESIGIIRFFNYNAGSGADQFFNYLNHSVITLPLEWLSFSAEKQDQQVHLSWSCEGSYIERFIVERAGEDLRFSPISESVLPDLNLRSETLHFTDFSPLKGSNYYRIKAQDRDGEISYSPLREIYMNKDVLRYIYPNPAKNRIVLEGNKDEIEMARIYDQTGRLLFEDSFKTHNFPEIDIQRFEAGSYILELVFNDRQTQVLHFIKD